MKNLTIQSYESVNKYFNALSKLGYFDYSHVYKLLLLLFVEDIIDGNFVDLIPEEDYRVIANCLYCIYGTSCLVPYQAYLTTIEVSKAPNYDKFRTSEDSEFRETELNEMRIA